MPPKAKITREDILQAALTLLREQGEDALNARSLATALSCSTQPIFSNFATMEELQEAARAAAYRLYLSFLQKETENGQYPPYKALGMAYIRFAREEKELFRLLFMCDRKGQEQTPTPDFEASVTLIMEGNGVSRETAERMHLEMWACVHGIAAMLATSFIPLETDLISDMISDVYFGLRARHVPKGAPA